MTWKIPADCCKIKAILDLASLLGQESLTSSRIKYVAGLWLNSKYGDSIAIDSYLKLTKPVWTQNEWTARQTASVWPRFNEDTKKWVKESLTSRGHFEGLKVIEHLKELTEKFKEKRIRTYLVPQENYRDKHYPLHKILLVLQFMHGVPNEEASALRESVIALVDDPVYKALLLRPN